MPQEQLMTGPGASSLSESGHAVFSNPKFVTHVLGRTPYWILMALSLLGLVTSLSWVIIGTLGSLPSYFDNITNTALLFTVFGGVTLGNWIAFSFLLWYFTSKKHATQTKSKTTWELISLINRRYFKIGLVVKLLAFMGIALTTITFLSARSQSFSHQFSETAFTPDPTGTISTVTAAPDSTSACLVLISNECNSNSTYTMDEITAQSYVNITHLTIVLSLMTALAYFVDVLNLLWLEVSVYKGESESFAGLQLSKLRLTHDGHSPVFLYTHQKSAKRAGLGAANDVTMFALKVTIIVGSVLLLILWIFQLLTIAGPADSLCTWFDSFGGFFIVDISVLWAFILVLGLILLAILLKDSVMLDTTNMQKVKIIFSISVLSIIAILLSILGGLWLSAHGDITFSIPHVILCRIHPYWRTYNGNTVLFASLFYVAVWVLADLYFTHTNKIGAIRLLEQKARKKKM